MVNYKIAKIGPDGKLPISVIPGGTVGKSAYQIAVDNGFVGTESQWLDSLKGSNGISVSQDSDNPNIVVINSAPGGYRVSSDPDNANVILLSDQ